MTIINITYCSANKANIPTTMKELYHSDRVTKFFEINPDGRIFSDLYGIMNNDTIYEPYEKPPWNVTEEEFVMLVEQSVKELSGSEVVFWVVGNTYHEMYQKLVVAWMNSGLNVTVRSM
jgi:hypothetical protein